MNWDAIAAISELIGALGVIASLAYLAVQIRQNTRQMADHGRALRLSAQEAISAAFSRWRDPLIRDPHLAALWIRGLRGDLASPEERLQFSLLLQDVLFAFQTAFYADSQGVRTSYGPLNVRVIRQILASPGGASWWEHNKTSFRGDFVSAVERERSAASPAV